LKKEFREFRQIEAIINELKLKRILKILCFLLYLRSMVWEKRKIIISLLGGWLGFAMNFLPTYVNIGNFNITFQTGLYGQITGMGI